MQPRVQEEAPCCNSTFSSNFILKFHLFFLQPSTHLLQLNIHFPLDWTWFSEPLVHSLICCRLILLKANNESLTFAHKEMITRGTDDEGDNFHLIHVDAGKVHGMHVV